MKRYSGMLSVIVVLTLWVHPSYAQRYLGQARFCGVPTFEVPNPNGASAASWQGQPVIFIDPSFGRNSALATFAIAHECAHFMLGHTLPEGQWFKNRTIWGTRIQELQADCWAAQAVGPQISQYMAANHAAQGPYPTGRGYPTGHERAINILRCAGLR